MLFCINSSMLAWSCSGIKHSIDRICPLIVLRPFYCPIFLSKRLRQHSSSKTKTDQLIALLFLEMQYRSTVIVHLLNHLKNLPYLANFNFPSRSNLSRTKKYFPFLKRKIIMAWSRRRYLAEIRPNHQGLGFQRIQQ